MLAPDTRLIQCAENLRFLCSYTRSVSQVCRHLDINRQQFARYLNGETFPSAHNLRKICDFFGIERQEFVGTPENLRAAFTARRASQARRRRAAAGAFDLTLPEGSSLALAQRYVGYYFRYTPAFDSPDAILKALVQVRADEDHVRTKVIECHSAANGSRGPSGVVRHRGTLMQLADRIFIVEAQTQRNAAISETILYPTHKHPMSLLFGETFGVSAPPTRAPRMRPVVYQFIGTAPHLRTAIRECAWYFGESLAISEKVRSFITRGERTP